LLRRQVHREKWLGLSQINWEDNKGRHRVWEAVTRTTKQTGVVDGTQRPSLFSLYTTQELRLLPSAY
jgi:hypothetical protein